MNVKPGDLAIQIMARIPENIGIIVTVQEWNPFFKEWLVTSERTLRGMGLVTGVINIIPAGELVCVPDEWLRPVSGLPMDEETTNDINEPA
jgi:hypothetical protein